jgi:uncharacterized protein with HEPN domain
MAPDEERDAALLFDIITAAREIQEFLTGIDFEAFQSNRLLRYAVERQLIVIGEASRHLSESFRARTPNIPWRAIVGLRNILAHEYGEILAERIWLVAIRDLKVLIEELEPHTHEN